MRVGSLLAPAVLAVAVGVLVPGPATATATATPRYATVPVRLVDLECSQIGLDDQPVESSTPSAPFDLLGMRDVWARLDRRGEVAGAGVRVAVVDSGVATGSRVPVAERVSFSVGDEIADYHGTAVAGLVAAPLRGARPEPLPLGFAPGAQVVDVRVYDSTQPGVGQVGVETERVVQGLRWVADNADRLGIRVATVALVVPPSDELEAAVRAVLDQDVVLVAGSGNRPADGEPLFEEFGEVRTGEDAAGAVFPAGYDGVLAVSATAGGVPDADDETDVRGSVLQSSAIDVAAPTYGAVTTSVTGGTCVLPAVATSWAAAEVAGIVAMLRAAAPRRELPPGRGPPPRDRRRLDRRPQQPHRRRGGAARRSPGASLAPWPRGPRAHQRRGARPKPAGHRPGAGRGPPRRDQAQRDLARPDRGFGPGRGRAAAAAPGASPRGRAPLTS